MARQADHNRAEDLISAYLDQQVTAEEKQFFELHMAACADCRAQLEATRSMVAALKAMPIVKAPRSFVLPREMAKQPKRSIFAWYPTLRLATALAAIAFVVLFAGDMLISRSGSGGVALSVPMAAPAPQLEQATTAMRVAAPTAVAQAAPTEAPAPAANNSAATEPSVAAAPPAAAPSMTAGAAAKSVSTDTATLTDTAATMLAASTPTLEVTAVAAAPQPPLEVTPEPAADAQAKRAATSAVEQPVSVPVAVAPAPTIDPLRVIELVLLGLVIVLGAAMLIARRKQI
jgi:predicted anti-sigma-YlaC factor YlaD